MASNLEQMICGVLGMTWHNVGWGGVIYGLDLEILPLDTN